MGNIRQVLATVDLEDYPSKQLAIEMNHGTTGGRDIVHIQTELWRIELDESEWREFAQAVVKAARKLRSLKGDVDGEQAERNLDGHLPGVSPVAPSPN